MRALIKQTANKIDGTLIEKQLMQLCVHISMILDSASWSSEEKQHPCPHQRVALISWRAKSSRGVGPKFA